MKNKIIKLVAFCMAICLMISLPALFSVASEIYLNITMKNTGKLPVVNTYKNLENLVGDTYTTYSYSTPRIKNIPSSFDASISADFSAGIPSANNYISNSFDGLSFDSFSSKSSTSSSNYSSTNIQVANVDEADILKNDGKYIYTISKNKLVIVEAFPANELKKLSELEIENNYRAIDLFLSGNKLFLITDTYKEETRTKILVLDIVDRTSPKVVKTFEFTGTYGSSRKIGEKIYVFSNMPAYLKNGTYKVPGYRENDVSNFIDVPLSEIQYVPNDTYNSYTQIFAFDIGSPLNSPKIVTYLGSSAKNVYMSENNLYLAQNRYNETVIYKFNLNNVYPRYEAKGTVPGTIINQFAMDEYNDNFRIATTKNNVNGVYILSKSMHRLGSVSNIARGEQIKSVRFEGDRGYVVTFRNTDPLFVLDLSRIRAPKILGELKLPGYSTYLHPYDENHVIGFGYDGTDRGTNGKLKLALFDITDVENPREKFKEVIDSRTSELLTNHKALLFSKEKNLLAFSVGDYNFTYNSKNNKSKIGKVYTINLSNGFTLRGEITHSSDVNRMLFMDDVLYGVSESNVSAHDINTIEELNRIDI